MKTCNNLTTLGHGEAARCGEKFYGQAYQCGECARKELAETRITLEAESKGADRAAEALIAHYRDLVKAREHLATLVKLLKIVSADPHRAWQVVEQIDEAIKQVEELG